MSKYIPDVLSRRWVIVSSQRLERPDDNLKTKKKNLCVFCPGNESYTPSEVLRIGKGEKDKPGWQVRVVPNKYPITDIHEVIIHSPHDDKDIEHLAVNQVEHIFHAYRERYNYYRKRGQVFIFCNHGEHSGASLHHPHSQLVVIPSQINLDMLTREPLNNVITDNSFFYVYCPDFSQWPYEVWIAPKIEGKVFGDITDEEITDLSGIMQKTIHRLKKIFESHTFNRNPFGYNYYLYPKENWYLRIIPRFVHRAGFELGTGLSVNIIDPMLASRDMRGEEDQINKLLRKLEKKVSGRGKKST